MRCRSKEVIDGAYPVTFKNGTNAMKGLCAKCGAGITAIQKKTV